MANVLVDENALSSIASAIREKNGTTDTYKPAEMGPAISAIEAGGGGSDFFMMPYNDWSNFASKAIITKGASVDSDNTIYDVGNYFNPSTTPFLLTGDLETSGTFTSYLVYVNYPEKFIRYFHSVSKKGSSSQTEAARFTSGSGDPFEQQTFNSSGKAGWFKSFTDTSFVLGPLVYEYSKRASNVAIIPLGG